MDTGPIPNNRNLARQRYQQTRREVQEGDQDRVRGARDALARLSEVRAQRLGRARSASGDAISEAARRNAADNASTTPARPDSVEISSRARQMAAGLEEPTADEARAERVAELKAQFRAGELNTPERTERAAANMLRDGLAGGE